MGICSCLGCPLQPEFPQYHLHLKSTEVENTMHPDFTKFKPNISPSLALLVEPSLTECESLFQFNKENRLICEKSDKSCHHQFSHTSWWWDCTVYFLVHCICLLIYNLFWFDMRYVFSRGDESSRSWKCPSSWKYPSF